MGRGKIRRFLKVNLISIIAPKGHERRRCKAIARRAPSNLPILYPKPIDAAKLPDIVRDQCQVTRPRLACNQKVERSDGRPGFRKHRADFARLARILCIERDDFQPQDVQHSKILRRSAAFIGTPEQFVRRYGGYPEIARLMGPYSVRDCGLPGQQTDHGVRVERIDHAKKFIAGRSCMGISSVVASAKSSST